MQKGLAAMLKSLIVGIIILPVSVVLFIPILLLYVSYVFFGDMIVVSQSVFVQVVSVCFFAVGFLLAGVTTWLFFKIGRGTPAPWDPPKKFVIEGPYRYVRNPMIFGVFCILLGEAVLFWSMILFCWVLVFFLANEVYIPLVEEKGLVRRFGKEYIIYTKHVRRWIPRLTPWSN